MKNLIRKRREQGATCKACRSPDYATIKPVEGEQLKPLFICNSCGNVWTYGVDGGIYMKLSGISD